MLSTKSWSCASISKAEREVRKEAAVWITTILSLPSFKKVGWQVESGRKYSISLGPFPSVQGLPLPSLLFLSSF